MIYFMGAILTQGVSIKVLRNDRYTCTTVRGDVNKEKVQGDAKEQDRLISK